MEPLQTRWKWHHTTFTPSLPFVPFCQPCLVFVGREHVGCLTCRRLWKEQCCVRNVDVHGEWIMFINTCSFIATEHEWSCMQKGYVDSCSFIRADHSIHLIVLYAEGCGNNKSYSYLCVKYVPTVMDFTKIVWAWYLKPKLSEDHIPRFVRPHWFINTAPHTKLQDEHDVVCAF